MPSSSSSYRTWRIGCFDVISRPRSIGVPVTTTSHSAALIVASSSCELLVAVAHRRAGRSSMLRVLLERSPRSSRRRTAAGRRSSPRPRVARGDEPGAERHPAVRERRAVVDDEHALAEQVEARSRASAGDSAEMTRAVGFTRLDVREHLLDVVRLGRVDLVDDDDVGHPQVRLARVVAELVPGPERVDDDDRAGRARRTGSRCCPPSQTMTSASASARSQDRLVVDAGVHDHAQLDRELVLLALLDRRVRGVDLLERREALHAHRLEVAVRHRMPDERDLQAGVEQDAADLAARLALAAAGADGADRDHGLRRSRASSRSGPSRRKSAPAARTIDALCITVLVREVGVGEDDLVDPLALGSASASSSSGLIGMPSG